MKEETKLISFISKSCCLCQLKILNQDAAALEWVWQFKSECLTLDESGIWTESVSELYRRRNSGFSGIIRWLREKPQLLSIGNSLVSCFHLQWRSMLSRDENLTEGPESKHEYSRLWGVFSECFHILKVEMTPSRILFSCSIYSSWTLTRHVPLRKLNSLCLIFIMYKMEIKCIYFM